MEELSLSEVQESALSMLDAVDNHCRAQNLNYFLAYGSLLGAVRHGGFIPWDDDADVWMLRSDFENFISSFNSIDHIRLLHPCQRGYRIGWAKLIDSRTVYYNERVIMPADYGFSIDIFPLDDDRGPAIDGIVRKQSRLRSAATTANRTHRQNLPRRAAKALVHRAPRFLYGKTAQTLVIGSKPDSEHVVNHFSRYPYEVERMPRAWFSETETIPFGDDGRSYLIPRKPERILEAIYGKNWRVPRVDQRHAKIYWRESVAG